MKKEIAQYVARCDTCQRTKAEHQKPAGLLQPLPIPEWKWEEIGMYFVTGLPRSQRGNDSIWVIIDRLTKVAHFIPVKTTFGGAALARIYLKEIVRLHGIPRKIVSDRGTQFTEWKWEEIGMYFVTGLPRSQRGNDSIWVIIDRLTKVAHFIPVKTTFGGAALARIYLKEIVRLHGIPRKIVSDRGTQFTSKFWKGLQQAMGTKLDFSTAYHPQSDGQTERVNKVLEDLLRACVLAFDRDWESLKIYSEPAY